MGSASSADRAVDVFDRVGNRPCHGKGGCWRADQGCWVPAESMSCERPDTHEWQWSIDSCFNPCTLDEPAVRMHTPRRWSLSEDYSSFAVPDELSRNGISSSGFAGELQTRDTEGSSCHTLVSEPGPLHPVICFPEDDSSDVSATLSRRAQWVPQERQLTHESVTSFELAETSRCSVGREEVRCGGKGTCDLFAPRGNSTAARGG